MITTKRHWNAIFSAKSDHEPGWYESDAAQTLKFLDLIPQHKNARIFLPGAGTSILVDELLACGHDLILNDISDVALNSLESRIGPNDSLIWLHHDISKPLPEGIPQAYIWIDRAVLHFLLQETDIQSYFANLNSAVSPGGYVLLAEFSIAGAPECAGLELHRYSVEEMTERIGAGFKLVMHEEYTFFNPAGDPRPYVYALYRKQTG